jgi:hypothetical protein
MKYANKDNYTGKWKNDLKDGNGKNETRLNLLGWQ